MPIASPRVCMGTGSARAFRATLATEFPKLLFSGKYLNEPRHSTASGSRLSHHLASSRIISHESERSDSAEPRTQVALQIPESLRPSLTTLMGNGGYRALLMRSLALASPAVPSLRSISVSVEGNLDGYQPLLETLSPEELKDGRVELGAQLIGLLVAFIGEKLTLQLLGEAWPGMSDADLKLTPNDRK